MKRVISFSLWGNNPTYTIGAIKNAELALLYYPDFECWFYIHKDSVPSSIIDQLMLKPNVVIIFKTGVLDKPMSWRFETIDSPEVEINMSRDTDTRILLREKLAVEQWIQSGKTFHIMRDHPHHMNIKTPIMGGMFGTKKIKSISSWTNLIENQELKDNGRKYYNKDQDFLNRFIYPEIRNDCFIHSSFGKLFNEMVHPFPIKYCDNYFFVGGYVYWDESVSIEHKNILMNSLKR